jgi:hypothetical protein
VQYDCDSARSTRPGRAGQAALSEGSNDVGMLVWHNDVVGVRTTSSRQECLLSLYSTQHSTVQAKLVLLYSITSSTRAKRRTVGVGVALLASRCKPLL